MKRSQGGILTSTSNGAIFPICFLHSYAVLSTVYIEFGKQFLSMLMFLDMHSGSCLVI